LDNDKFQELVINQLSSLAEDVKGAKNDVETVKKDVDTLKPHQQGIKQDVETVKSHQLQMETKIENEVVKRIRALFDDRSMNQDYFTSIKDSLARIEDRVEFIARQSIEHLVKPREHDRELRLLRIEKT